MSKYFKPARPFPNRGNSLWTGCTWAWPAGWGKGFRDNGDLSTLEDVHKGRGDIQTTPDTGNFAVQDMGRVIANTGATKDKIVWTNVGSRYNPTHDSLTACALVRPNEIGFNQVKTILDIINSDDVFTGSYTFQIRLDDIGPVNKFQFALRIAGNKVLTSATSFTTTDTWMFLCTYDGATQKIYLNGRLDATRAQTGTPSKGAWPVRVFGATSNAMPFLDAFVGMGAIWERVLTDSEIRSLAADPYQMWKQLNPPEGQAAAAQFNTYFNAF